MGSPKLEEPRARQSDAAGQAAADVSTGRSNGLAMYCTCHEIPFHSATLGLSKLEALPIHFEGPAAMQLRLEVQFTFDEPAGGCGTFQTPARGPEIVGGAVDVI